MRKVLFYDLETPCVISKLHTYLLGCINSSNSQITSNEFAFVNQKYNSSIDFQSELTIDNEKFFYTDSIKLIFNQFDATNALYDCGCFKIIYDYLSNGFFALCQCNYSTICNDNANDKLVNHEYILISGIDLYNQNIYFADIDNHKSKINIIDFGCFASALTDFGNKSKCIDIVFIKSKIIVSL